MFMCTATVAGVGAYRTERCPFFICLLLVSYGGYIIWRLRSCAKSQALCVHYYS